MKEKKLIELTIVHWEENLTLAKAGRLFTDDISAHYCALCKEFDCITCPLTKYEKCCTNDSSKWHKVFILLTHNTGENFNLVMAITDMLAMLKRVKSKY